MSELVVQEPGLVKLRLYTDPSFRTDYGYDGLNLRVWVQKKNASTGVLYKTYEITSANGQLISEYTPSIGGNAASSYITKTLTEHVYLGNLRLAESRRTTMHTPGSPTSNQYLNTYYHLDPAGTALLASTPQGTVLWHVP